MRVFLNLYPDNLWRCWIGWGQVRIPGKVCVWQAASLSRKHQSAPSDFSLWASFQFIPLTICPVSILPACIGGGHGKQCQLPYWSPEVWTALAMSSQPVNSAASLKAITELWRTLKRYQNKSGKIIGVFFPFWQYLHYRHLGIICRF